MALIGVGDHVVSTTEDEHAGVRGVVKYVHVQRFVNEDGEPGFRRALTVQYGPTRRDRLTFIEHELRLDLDTTEMLEAWLDA